MNTIDEVVYYVSCHVIHVLYTVNMTVGSSWHSTEPIINVFFSRDAYMLKYTYG